MKKIFAILSALMLTAGFAKAAHAECDGLYVGLRGGIVQHKIDSDSGFFSTSTATNGIDDQKLMIAGALGYRYEWFRSELELVWRDYTKESETRYSTKFKTYSYMWNFYWDILPYNWLSPYVNVGIGLSKLKYHSSDNYGNPARGHFDTTRFTWALGGGFTVKVTNRWNVDLGYRYYDMGNFKKADITAQEGYVGVRYVF